MSDATCVHTETVIFLGQKDSLSKKWRFPFPEVGSWWWMKRPKKRRVPFSYSFFGPQHLSHTKRESREWM